MAREREIPVPPLRECRHLGVFAGQIVAVGQRFKKRAAEVGRHRKTGRRPPFAGTSGALTADAATGAATLGCSWRDSRSRAIASRGHCATGLLGGQAVVLATTTRTCTVERRQRGRRLVPSASRRSLPALKRWGVSNPPVLTGHRPRARHGGLLTPLCPYRDVSHILVAICAPIA